MTASNPPGETLQASSGALTIVWSGWIARARRDDRLSTSTPVKCARRPSASAAAMIVPVPQPGSSTSEVPEAPTPSVASARTMAMATGLGV